MLAEKLSLGDEIRIITPCRSLSILSEQNIRYAKRTLELLGYKVTFGSNVHEINVFNSSSIQSRVKDLHSAFTDTSVKCVLSVLGGYNSNQLLEYIDYV